MQRCAIILVMCMAGVSSASSQEAVHSTPPPSVISVAPVQSATQPTTPFTPQFSAGGAPPGDVAIDGIAVHIEGDIITESELAELAAVQELLDGKSHSREDLANELVDQWVVKQEAESGRFPAPADAQVQAAFDRLAAQVPSKTVFETKLKDLGLDNEAVKRQLGRQLYLSSFIEYRFRPGIEISDKEVNEYYQTELTPALKKQNQTVPALAGVQTNIRELLTEREVNRRANEWIAEARSRLRIEIASGGGA